MKKFVFTFVLLGWFQFAHSFTLEGVLLEKGTRVPLSNVNIFILPQNVKATTGTDGRFQFENLNIQDQEEIQWIINFSGYLRLDQKEKINMSAPPALKEFYLEKLSYQQAYKTTILGKEDKRETQKKTLQREEVLKMPGAGGDPVKAVQNLPGVSRVSSFQSNVVIQGSAPQDTKYHLNSHEIPLVFHFGGLTSVVFPEAFESVDYLSAGYGVESSRALGGVINVKIRSPRKDRMHGMAFVDLIHTGALWEGPVGKKGGSFLLSGRYSYIGPVLKLFAPKEGGFNLTVAPQYSDLLGVYEQPFSKKTDFKLIMLGSLDSLKFLLTNPIGQDPKLRGTFLYQTQFYRFIPTLEHRHGAATVSRYSLGFGQDFIKTNVGENFFQLKNQQMSVRGELEHEWNEVLTSHLGMDNVYQRTIARLNLPRSYQSGGVSNPLSSGESEDVTLKRKLNSIGLFQRNEWWVVPEKLKFIPALRTDYFSSTQEWKLGPRALLQYFFNPYFHVRGASGFYYQAPQPQEVDAQYGNPDLKASQAIHYTLTFEKDFRENESTGVVASLGGFYRDYNQLVIQSTARKVVEGRSVFEKYNNKGEGRSYGGEFFLKAYFAPLTGWASYTLSRSVRSDPNREEYLYRYDQTHHVNLLVSYELPRNWSLSSRFRYVTGNLTTPITGGTYDTDNAVTVPTRGPFYSERLNAFYQLDLRVDKKWIFNQWILSAYLDIQNVTNRKNVESVSYAYDYDSKQNVTGLPILPTIGVKGEF